MIVRAIYRIPSVDLVLVVCKKERQDRMNEHTYYHQLYKNEPVDKVPLKKCLFDKNYPKDRQIAPWDIRIIYEHHFFECLREVNKRVKNKTGSNFITPTELDMLSINVHKKNEDYKVLCKVPSDDIIEVYV